MRPTMRDRIAYVTDTNINFNDYLKAAGSGALVVMGVDYWNNGDRAMAIVCAVLFVVALFLLRFEGQGKPEGILVYMPPEEVKEFVGETKVIWCGLEEDHNPHRWTHTREEVTSGGIVWASTDDPEGVCLGHECGNPKTHMVVRS